VHPDKIRSRCCTRSLCHAASGNSLETFRRSRESVLKHDSLRRLRSASADEDQGSISGTLPRQRHSVLRMSGLRRGKSRVCDQPANGIERQRSALPNACLICGPMERPPLTILGDALVACRCGGLTTESVAEVSCPGRGAACNVAPQSRDPHTCANRRMGPGSAAHRFALRCRAGERVQIGLPAYGIEAVRPPSTGIAWPLT